MALTYGPDADRVCNVLAVGGCTLQTQGRTIRLTRPRLFRDSRRRDMPPIIRQTLAVGKVADYLELYPDTDESSTTAPCRSA